MAVKQYWSQTGFGLRVYCTATQTFTTTTAYTLNQVLLKLKKNTGQAATTILVNLYAVDINHKPTGSSLVSIGSITDADLTTSYAWKTFTGFSYTLTATTEYAIVLTITGSQVCVTGGSTDCGVYWEGKSGYSGGIGWVKYCAKNGSWACQTTWSSATVDFDFYTYSADLPSKPINPTPINEAIEVDWSGKTISWQNGGEATSYNVYFGQNGNMISLGNQIETSKIVPYTTEIIGETVHAYVGGIEIDWNIPFYWRIDAVNASGTTTGDIWHFDARPAKVTNPVPNDNTDGVSLAFNTLGWAESELATTYDFYFREEGNDWEYIGDTDELTINIPIVFTKYFQVYEWRIDAVNEFGITTGDTWTFIIMHSHSFPYERRSDYDYDWTWDPVTGTWKDYTGAIAGGGRYKNQLVVVGHKCIYIGDV